jgi:hypothetical protein
LSGRYKRSQNNLTNGTVGKKEGYKNEKNSFLDVISDGDLILWMQHGLRLWIAKNRKPRQCVDQYQFTPHAKRNA